MDGCAVSFKRDRFSLVSQHPVEYFRRGVPSLDRDNVGQVVLLRPLDPPSGPSGSPGPSGPSGPSGPGQVLCVANTHLLYNPRRGDVKLAQLALLLAEITRVSRREDGSACPVVLCGDFNSVPWSPLYSFIRDSWLEYEGIPIGKVRASGVPPEILYDTIPSTPRDPQSTCCRDRGNANGHGHTVFMVAGAPVFVVLCGGQHF